MKSVFEKRIQRRNMMNNAYSFCMLSAVIAVSSFSINPKLALASNMMGLGCSILIYVKDRTIQDFTAFTNSKDQYTKRMKISLDDGTDHKISIISSRELNAYVYDTGDISITDKLFRKTKEKETQFIAKHEIAHKNLGHKAARNSALRRFAQLSLYQMAFASLIDGDPVKTLCLFALPPMINAFAQLHEQKEEYFADSLALAYSKDLKSAVSFLEKAEKWHQKSCVRSKKQKFNLKDKLFDKILIEHPSTQGRIHNLKRSYNEMNKCG